MTTNAGKTHMENNPYLEPIVTRTAIAQNKVYTDRPIMPVEGLTNTEYELAIAAVRGMLPKQIDNDTSLKLKSIKTRIPTYIFPEFHRFYAETFNNDESTGTESTTTTALAPPDPLLDPSLNRLALPHNSQTTTWDYYVTASRTVMRHLWLFQTATPQEERLDMHNFWSLDETERSFFLNTIGNMAQIKGLLARNVHENFWKRIQSPEARCFFHVQATGYDAHNLICSKLTMAMAPSTLEGEAILSGGYIYTALMRKTEWLHHWIYTKQRTMAERLVAFAAMEWIWNTSVHCYAMRGYYNNTLHTLSKYIDMIDEIETLNTRMICHLYRQTTTPCSPENITSIIKAAVDIEQHLVETAAEDLSDEGTAVFDFRSNTVEDLIKFKADCLLEFLGQPKQYNAVNHASWLLQVPALSSHEP